MVNSIALLHSPEQALRFGLEEPALPLAEWIERFHATGSSMEVCGPNYENDITPSVWNVDPAEVGKLMMRVDQSGQRAAIDFSQTSLLVSHTPSEAIREIGSDLPVIEGRSSAIYRVPDESRHSLLQYTPKHVRYHEFGGLVLYVSQSGLDHLKQIFSEAPYQRTR